MTDSVRMVRNPELLKEQEIHIQPIEENEVKQVNTFIENKERKEETGKQLPSPQEAFVEVFPEIAKEGEIEEPLGNVPQLPELEILNQPAIQQEGKDAPAEVIEPKALKAVVKARDDKMQVLPPELTSVVNKILSWRGKLTAESSGPIITAIRNMKAAASDAQKAACLAELTTAALNYLDLRRGYRFTSSGRERQRDVKALVKSIGAFLPEARDVYVNALRDALKGDAEEMPEKYRSFYQENAVQLREEQNVSEYLNNVYGEKEREQKHLSKYEREPHAEVKLSALSAQEFANQFAPAYNEVVTKEVRRQKQQNKRSRLYKKLQNKELLEAIERQEAITYDDDMTKEKFLRLLDDYMKIDLKDIDLSSDAAVVASASRMEKMVQKHQRLVVAIQTYRSAYQGLSRDAQAILTNQMSTLSLLTSYYRVCKAIIKDALYSSHYDHELSLSADIIAGDAGQQRLSTLLHMKMILEGKMVAMCPQGMEHKERASLKNSSDLNFYTEDEIEATQRNRDIAKYYRNGFWAKEFNKSVPNDSTNYNIHYDALNKLEQGTKEYQLLAVSKLEVDGIKMEESILRTMISIGNLRTAAGLGMAKQELTDLLSDLCAKQDNTLPPREAEARYIRGFKKMRDMFIAHARYITDKYRGSYNIMNAQEAEDHKEEILQDLQLVTNLGEAFSFFKRCPSLFEDPGKLKEINDISMDLSALSLYNQANASITEEKLEVEVQDGDSTVRQYQSNASLLYRKADFLVSSLEGPTIPVCVTANGLLHDLERNTSQDSIQWEGAHTAEELDKAKELSDMGELAYMIKKTRAKTLVGAVDPKEAIKALDEASENMPLLQEMTVTVVRDKLGSFKLARLQWDSLKDSKEIPKEKKDQYAEFASKYDALEKYLDAYSDMIRHPGYVKLAMRGITLPQDGLLVPPYTTEYLESCLSAYRSSTKDTPSPDTINALKQMQNLVNRWHDFIGSQDEEVDAFREKHYRAEILADKSTQEERALNGDVNFISYHGMLSVNLKKYGRKNNITLSGVNSRKLFILISALSAIEDISLDKCRELYRDLSVSAKNLMDKPELLAKKATAIERLFDALMGVDFSKIHTDREHVTENGDIAVILTHVGMELQEFCDDYKKIAASGKVKNLKYDEAGIKEIDARRLALQEILAPVKTNLQLLKDPIAQTAEGKRLLGMNATQLMDWISAHRDASELSIFAQSIQKLKDREMVGTANLTPEQLLEKSRKELGIGNDGFVDPFGQRYIETLTADERKQAQKEENSPLYRKLQNKKLLESIEKKAGKAHGNEMTEEEFQRLLDDYMKIDLKDIDLSSDAAVVDSASRMEKMVQTHQRLVDALQTQRPAYEGLSEEVLENLKKQMHALSLVTSYYRVCKAIIKDSLYSSHYDHELSLSADIIAGDARQQRLSTLLHMRMILEEEMEEMRSPEMGQEEHASRKDASALNLYTEDKDEATKLGQQIAEHYGEGFWALEFNKAHPNTSMKYNIHYDTLKTLGPGTKEYQLLTQGRLEVEGIEMSKSILQTMVSLGNLRATAGLGMAKQELKDILSDLCAKGDATLPPAEADARYIRGVKRMRDMFIAHGKYITDKYRGSFLNMKAKAAKAHKEEIQQDLQLTADLSEAFGFFMRCPSLFEEPGKLKEIKDISMNLNALSVFNRANNDVLTTPLEPRDQDGNLIAGKYHSNASLLHVKARTLTSCLLDTSVSGCATAHGVLRDLEHNTSQKSIQWEGAHTEEELNKAEELSGMGELAYKIKKTRTKTLADAIDPNAAIAALNEASEIMPLLQEMTVEVVRDKLDSFKLARLQWDSLKNSEELTKEQKDKYEAFASKYDALEDYLEAYSDMIRHPGYVKLAMRGITLPQDGLLAPPYTTEYLQSYLLACQDDGNDALSPDTRDALNRMSSLVDRWHALIGSQDTEVDAFRNKHYSAEVLADKNTQEERALNGSDNFTSYRSILSDHLRRYGEKNKIRMGINERKLFTLLSALSAIVGISLDECHELYRDLSEKVDTLMDKPELLAKKARAIERLFDALMEVDFSKIHADKEHVTENGDISVIWVYFGMELDNFYDEYVKIANSGKIKDLKYDEAQRTEIKARFSTLQDVQIRVTFNLKLLKDPLAKTEEGKRLLSMNYEQLTVWFSEHKDDPKLRIFASSVFALKSYEATADTSLTATQSLEASRKRLGLDENGNN